MYKSAITLTTLALAAQLAQADVVTQWNFNSAIADSKTSTGSLAPAIGKGLASTVGGATSPGFFTGDGSSDPATMDDSGWQTTSYAAQGRENKTRGVQFMVSTLGFEKIRFSWDQRLSNTSARHAQIQYTLDGSSFVDLVGGLRQIGDKGDTWFNGLTADFSSIAGVANNAHFGVRIVQSFANGGSSYEAAKTGSPYGAGGTWRFDMVTVQGQKIAPVPEPETYALMLAGLLAIGMVSRRRGR